MVFIGMKPDNVKILEIRAQDLHELEKADMSRFIELETVLITFTADPEAPFSEKQKVIDMVYKNLDFLSELKASPALKNISLQVGERLFIKETENLTGAAADKQNLLRAGNAFEGKIKNILPDVKIYAHNWGW